MERLTLKNDIGHYALKTVLNAELGIHLGSKVSPVFDAIDRLGPLEDLLESGELVRVVHGEWKKDRDIIKCSTCGFGMFPTGYYFKDGECFSANKANYRPSYCPSCGAKMDGKPIKSGGI